MWETLTCRAWNMTQDTLFTCPLKVSTSHAFVSAQHEAAIVMEQAAAAALRLWVSFPSPGRKGSLDA